MVNIAIDCLFFNWKGKINQLDGKMNQLNRKHDYTLRPNRKKHDSEVGNSFNMIQLNHKSEY
jgi:hypothetical protein